jgi:hypothetical protein
MTARKKPVKKDYLHQLLYESKAAIVLLVVFLVTASTFVFLSDNKDFFLPQQSSIKHEPAKQKNSNHNTQQNYQASMKSILSSYLAERQNYYSPGDAIISLDDMAFSNWLAKLERTNAELLELIVPVSMKTIHLETVIALRLEEQGLQSISQGKSNGTINLVNEGQAKIQQADATLAAVLENNPWLR